MIEDGFGHFSLSRFVRNDMEIVASLEEITGYNYSTLFISRTNNLIYQEN